MPRQFVKCVFRPGDSRSYTYLNEGDPVASGDWVKVPDKSGEGWKKVQVVEVSTASLPSPASRSSGSTPGRTPRQTRRPATQPPFAMKTKRPSRAGSTTATEPQKIRSNRR